MAEYYQNLAVRLDRGYDEYLEKREELIRTYKEQGRRKEIQEALKQLQWKPDEAQMPEDLCYLTGKYLEAYLHDVEICQQFARRNREKMAEILLERTGLTGTDAFHTIHNYIDTNEMYWTLKPTARKIRRRMAATGSHFCRGWQFRLDSCFSSSIPLTSVSCSFQALQALRRRRRHNRAMCFLPMYLRPKTCRSRSQAALPSVFPLPDRSR